MKDIFDNLFAVLGILLLGFLLGVLAVADALTDRPKIMKDAGGLHVSYQDKLFRLVENEVTP